MPTALSRGSSGRPCARLAGRSRWPRFGARGELASTVLVRRFSGDHAPGKFAGLAAHSMIRLSQPLTAVGLMFGMLGHAYGWPIVEGGSGRLVDALVGALRAAGGDVETGRRVRRLSDIPPARAVLFDPAPPAVAAIAGDGSPLVQARVESPPARSGRLQARPGARRAGAVDGPGVPPGRHRAPRWNLCRDRGRRGGRHPRPRSGTAVRPPRTADGVRSVSGPGGQARGVGLLSRPERR